MPPHYADRMLRVLDHIDRNPDADLSLDRLSAVAAFSKYHFHRQFSALSGMSVHRYVQLVRMQRASYQLAFRDADTVTQIAIESGYEAPDAFARAFRRHFGQSPSGFRTMPDWQSWLAALGPLNTARSKHRHDYDLSHVTIADFPATPVAVMEHHGDPDAIFATVQRFIAWRRAAGLGKHVSATFNIFHSAPRTTPPEDFRMDVCAATNGPIAATDEAVRDGLIPAGRCAVLRVVGESENLETAALFLYRDWLPQSGEAPRDFPLFCQRVQFYPDVPQPDAVTDLFLPIEQNGAGARCAY